MNDTIEAISPRRKMILKLIEESSGLSRDEIQKAVSPFYIVSKPTLIRDLNFLAGKKLISSSGRAKAKIYKPASANPLLKFFDLDGYFAVDPDKRLEAKKHFDFRIFDNLEDLFSKEELLELKKNSKSFLKETRKLDPDILKRELERFVIELSWKSSKIEGNTYSLLQTEKLLKGFEEAPNKTKEEKQMIINHKNAFESILSNTKSFKKLSAGTIHQLHNTLVEGLNIKTGIRRNAVGITGSVYKPLDNEFQIREALEKTVTAINRNKKPIEKAFIAQIMIAYIQPYADGNKRTSRMLTNAILMAHNLFPLSYRSIDEEKYKKAIILFYEQNSLYHLKKMFIEQVVFANQTYFG